MWALIKEHKANLHTPCPRRRMDTSLAILKQNQESIYCKVIQNQIKEKISMPKICKREKRAAGQRMNLNISTCHCISDIYTEEVNNTSSTSVNAKAAEKHTYEERQKEEGRDREKHTDPTLSMLGFLALACRMCLRRRRLE